MRFTKANIKDIKATKAGYKLELYFKEFIGMNVPCVEVIDHHYKSAEVGLQTLSVGAKRWAPNVKVKKSGDRIFLVRTDID